MVEGRADHLSARPWVDVTRFSVVESVRHLIAAYRSFIKISYRLADPGLREIRGDDMSAIRYKIARQVL